MRRIYHTDEPVGSMIAYSLLGAAAINCGLHQQEQTIRPVQKKQRILDNELRVSIDIALEKSEVQFESFISFFQPFSCASYFSVSFLPPGLCSGKHHRCQQGKKSKGKKFEFL